MRMSMSSGGRAAVAAVAEGRSKEKYGTGARGGVELTHSYVDLAQPTAARQDKLFQTYGFHCSCARCCSSGTGNTGSSLMVSEQLASTGSVENDIRRAAATATCNVTTTTTTSGISVGTCAGGCGEKDNGNHEQLVRIDVESAITATRGGDSGSGGKGAEAKAEAARWHRQAVLASFWDNEQAGGLEEVRCLQKALHALQHTCGPFSFELYKVHPFE
jgi:hypothetical protein